MQTMITTTTRRKVFILANQLTKLAGLTRSEALTYAWDYIRNHDSDCAVLTATKKDGTIMRRLVTDWNKHNTVKGTGRPKPKNLKLFTDVAKMEAGIAYHTISAYQHNIINLAA